jgi:hypothetical protein
MISCSTADGRHNYGDWCNLTRSKTCLDCGRVINETDVALGRPFAIRESRTPQSAAVSAGCLLCGGQGHDHLQCPGTVEDPDETKRIVREARPALDQRPMGPDQDGE